LIGRMCKRGNAFSLPVLIARVSLIALIFNAHFCVRASRACRMFSHLYLPKMGLHL
jgi:hypothetical protein